MLVIHGVPFSAHTRKVLAAAEFKQLPYELAQLVPLGPELPQWFVDANPLRKIPVLSHAGRTVVDSTVIALYLDRVFPQNPVYPTEPGAYARAMFIEELVDAALAPHVLHGLLFQRVFGPKFLGQAPDEALVQHSLTEGIPPRLNDLEARLTGEWFGGAFSYADITVASMLLNLHYAGERIEKHDHPRLFEFLRCALQAPVFRALLTREAVAARGLTELDTSLLDELGY